MQSLVIDTNIVLDLWVFDEPALAPLKAALQEGRLPWLATQAMRDELKHVLGYPHIAARMARGGVAATAVLAAFDTHALLTEAAPKAPHTCKDPDDQIFIDLATAHRATLLSKDKQVLCMAKRLKASASPVCTATEFVAQSCPPASAASST